MELRVTNPCPVRVNHPPKNRVWDFETTFHLCAGHLPSQPFETVSETSSTFTVNVSGLPCWPSRDPIGERGGLNLYLAMYNNLVNAIDAVGLWTLVDDGTWLVSDWNKVKGDFDDLKNTTVPNLLTEIDAGITKAEALPKKCAYRKYLINRLKKIRKLVKKVKDKLDSSTKIYLRAETWTDADMPKAETWKSWGKRKIRFNKNSSYSYFGTGDKSRRGTLFHELTHVHGTDDTTSKWWNDAHFLDDMVKDSWDAVAGNIRNKVILKKGEKCCPKKRWPDN